MRVSGKWAGFLLGVGLALAAGAHPWPVGAERVRAELNSAMAPLGGLRWGPLGPASLTLLPSPILRIEGVELFDSGGARLLKALDVDIGLRTERLFLGELSPQSATLLNPVALIDLDAARLGAARTPDGQTPPLGRLEARGGMAKIVSARRGIDTTIEDVDGWLEWTKTGRPLTVSVAAVWRGQPVAVEGWLEAPTQLPLGEPSGMKLQITSPPADLAFSGTWSPQGKDEFDGDLSARILSRDALRRWIGGAAPAPFAAQTISVKGKAVGGAESLVLDDAQLVIGGQTFEGSLSFSTLGGKTSASGTLAADALDVGAVLGPPPALLDAAGQWSRLPLIPAPSETLDLDLRVSAAHAAWGGRSIDDAAVSMLQRDGRLTVKLLEASAYQGALSGEISIQRADGGCETQAALSLENADVGALLNDLGVASYSGRGGFQGTLRAEGASPAELVAAARGSVTLDLQDGALAGINFEEALRRGQRRPIDISRDMASGSTKFASARARLEIADGEARIDSASAQGPGAILEASGTIGLVDREWRARIGAMQASTAGAPSTDAARLTISVSGPWAAPTFAVEPNVD